MRRKCNCSFKGKFHTIETKLKISRALKGKNSPLRGRHLSEETKQKISKATKGEKHHLYGKHLSEKTKQKLSEAGKRHAGGNANNWKGGKIKIICMTCKKDKYVKPSKIKKGMGKFCSLSCRSMWSIRNRKKQATDIERLIEDELIKRNILYTKQVPLLGVALVDFLLPNGIVIQCDGDYWHNLPGRKERDANQDFILNFSGYKIFRLKGSEIKKSANKCIDRIFAKNRIEKSNA